MTPGRLHIYLRLKSSEANSLRVGGVSLAQLDTQELIGLVVHLAESRRRLLAERERETARLFEPRRQATRGG